MLFVINITNNLNVCQIINKQARFTYLKLKTNKLKGFQILVFQVLHEPTLGRFEPTKADISYPQAVSVLACLRLIYPEIQASFFLIEPLILPADPLLKTRTSYLCR